MNEDSKMNAKEMYLYNGFTYTDNIVQEFFVNTYTHTQTFASSEFMELY